jgi:hypothetical protein
MPIDLVNFASFYGIDINWPKIYMLIFVHIVYMGAILYSHHQLQAVIMHGYFFFNINVYKCRSRSSLMAQLLLQVLMKVGIC